MLHCSAASLAHVGAHLRFGLIIRDPSDKPLLLDGSPNPGDEDEGVTMRALASEAQNLYALWQKGWVLLGLLTALVAGLEWWWRFGMKRLTACPPLSQLFRKPGDPKLACHESVNLSMSMVCFALVGHAGARAALFFCVWLQFQEPGCPGCMLVQS